MDEIFNDRPGLPTTHARQDETEHCHGTEEVDLELRSIVLLALLLNGAEKVDTGIVDKHIDPAKCACARSTAAIRCCGSVTSNSTASALSG